MQTANDALSFTACAQLGSRPVNAELSVVFVAA